MDLLFSSTLPTMLVPAIQFAFFTSAMHFVSSVVLRSNQPPSGLTLTKFYLKSHVEAMRLKFEEVKSLGPATAEEWVKGLEGNGKEKIADSARWEQWELSGGLRSLAMSQSGRSNPDYMDSATHGSGTIESNSGHSSPPSGGLGNRRGKPSSSSNAHGKQSIYSPSHTFCYGLKTQNVCPSCVTAKLSPFPGSIFCFKNFS